MRKLILILIIFLKGFSLAGWAQSAMPDKLDVNYLLSQKKYRNIHHDSFCRDDNYREIGNNALPERPTVLAYKTIERGEIRVGIQNHCATNFNKTANDGRCIKYVTTDRNVYHITAVKPKDSDGDVKVAFWIKDIDNFYYARLNHSTVSVYRYSNGKERKVYKAKRAGDRLEVFVNKRYYEIIVDGQKICKRRFKGGAQESSLCGLYFDNTDVSWVDDFIVDYPDDFDEVGIDEFVENGKVSNPQYGTYWSLENKCTSSETYTNKSLKSYRFELTKPDLKTGETASDKAVHSTLMLDGITAKGGNNYSGQAGGNKPLDSFVLSVDVFFPDAGNEAWLLDELFGELFIQVHHVGYRIPFSPSIAIYIHRGRLYLNTFSMENIAKGESVNENQVEQRKSLFARLNNDEEEKYLSNQGYGDKSFLPLLKKGEWHNITMYIKLGYNHNQDPRTVLYVDGEKIIDWNTPNAYNCQEYGEYMEFGIYKWNWSTKTDCDKTTIMRRVLYFDNIKFWI